MTLGDILNASLVESLAGYGGWIAIALLVITRKLVWHKDVAKVERRADKWEGIALKALGVADKMTVQAELTNTFLGNIPDPARNQTLGQTQEETSPE